jgi:tRNA (guanine10-N2)-methyltransferase
MMRAASQYGLEDKFLGCFTFDVTKNPIRRGSWIDAITTDPPCEPRVTMYSGFVLTTLGDGVRAGAKRLGKRLNKKNPTRDDAYILEDGTPSHLYVYNTSPAGEVGTR